MKLMTHIKVGLGFQSRLAVVFFNLASLMNIPFVAVDELNKQNIL